MWYFQVFGSVEWGFPCHPTKKGTCSPSKSTRQGLRFSAFHFTHEELCHLLAGALLPAPCPVLDQPTVSGAVREALIRLTSARKSEQGKILQALRTKARHWAMAHVPIFRTRRQAAKPRWLRGHLKDQRSTPLFLWAKSEGKIGHHFGLNMAFFVFVCLLDASTSPWAVSQPVPPAACVLARLCRSWRR